MQTQLAKNELEGVKDVRAAEQETRDAASNNGIERTIYALFKGVDQDFVESNRHFPNELQKGVNRYVNALTRGELSWEWEAKGDPPEEGTPAALLAAAGDLVQAATVDALCSGKFAFFPYVDDAGRLQISVLGGFLWPIFRPGNSTEVDAVLQITSSSAGGKVRYEVRRYTPGLLEVFGNLDDFTKYATVPGKEYPQPHAQGTLPVAFRISGRDANRLPEGLAQTAMPAWMAYVKASIMLNFITELGGFEERVFKSDALFDLAKESPNHPLLNQNRAIGPRKGRFLRSGDDYARLDPVPLTEYRERAAEAALGVRDAMNIPDTAGANLTGIALAEKREAYTETTGGLAALIEDALTEALALAAVMRPAEIVPGWRVTLTPRSTRDIEAERGAIRDDYKVGILPKSAALSGLQSLGVSYVTEDMVQAAEALEAMDGTIGGEGG